MSSRCAGALCGLALGSMACGGPHHLPCEERSEAVEELPRVPLAVGSVEVSAEVADDDEERSTAWAGRRCDLDALLWVPAAVEVPSVTLCDVEVAVDLVFVRDARVVALELDRAPCPDACEDCVGYGESGPEVDAVIWLLAGQVDVASGDAVSGLERVELPTAP